jgi:hypothetical protein
LRGEIETERDMVNRIKLDVFLYWKLDIDSGSKIIPNVVNIYRGEIKHVNNENILSIYHNSDL